MPRQAKLEHLAKLTSQLGDDELALLIQRNVLNEIQLIRAFIRCVFAKRRTLAVIVA